MFTENLVNRLFFARTGLNDRVISPRSQKMGELLEKFGVHWIEKLTPPLKGFIWKGTSSQDRRRLERNIVFLKEKNTGGGTR